MDITPSAEFIEAYRRVCGADADTGPRGVIPAMRDLRIMRRIYEELDKIMDDKAKESNQHE
jgi:hypothetical protein